MTIGLSTYAFLWRSSDRVENPMTLHDILETTAASGCSLLQICDFAPLDELSRRRAQRIAAPRRRTSGSNSSSAPAVSARCICAATWKWPPCLGVTLVRSMLNTATERPSEAAAIESLRGAAPQYAERGVTLALETYEQVPSAQLVRIIESVGSAALGVCLDPANCVAALELPRRRRHHRRAAREELARQRLRLHPASRLGRIQPGRLPTRGGIAGLRRHPQGRRSGIRQTSTRSSSTGCPGSRMPRRPARWKTNGRNTVSTI